jgi:hypothetical protein
LWGESGAQNVTLMRRGRDVQPCYGRRNDFAQSKKFYDALFVAMGGKRGVEDAKGRLIYAHNGGRFMVSEPIDGKPATHANGGTIGFSISDPKQADAWHKADARMAARRSFHLLSVRGPLTNQFPRT